MIRLGNRGTKPVVFVCIALNTNYEIISKVIQSLTQAEAVALFLDQTGYKAVIIHGPFRPKRAQVLDNTRTLKFASEQHKAVYGDWEVNALFLKEPANHAYLVFIKRVDGKKMQPPSGAIVVPISDLSIIKI